MSFLLVGSSDSLLVALVSREAQQQVKDAESWEARAFGKSESWMRRSGSDRRQAVYIASCCSKISVSVGASFVSEASKLA